MVIFYSGYELPGGHKCLSRVAIGHIYWYVYTSFQNVGEWGLLAG